MNSYRSLRRGIRIFLSLRPQEAERLFIDEEDIANSPVQTYGEYMPGDIKYKDVNNDGIINDEDIVPIGISSSPEIVYGLRQMG